MSILQKLTDEMKVAMKARDFARLSAVRMLISSLKYALVDIPEMTETDEIAVLTKEAKKRRESVLAYRAGGREELAKTEEFELSVIEQYLPKMMSEEEVRAKLSAISADWAGKNMGEVMKLALAELKGQADSSVVAKVVKELLTK
jgi:uncharacterized protein YqeY